MKMTMTTPCACPTSHEQNYDSEPEAKNDNDEEDTTNQHSLPTFPEQQNYMYDHTLTNKPHALFGPLMLRRAHGVLTITLAVVLMGVLVQNANEKRQRTNLFASSTSTSTASTSSSTSTSTSSTTSRASSWLPLPSNDTVLSSIAFGSCMKEDMPQPFWDTLVQLNPDVTILGGDNVYMKGIKECQDRTCKDLKYAYDVLNAHPSFAGAKASLPMVAQLDDHDYGKNDCHSTNPFKDVAKEWFLEFMEEPLDSPRRRDNDGLYTYYEWGPIGKRVQLILLDTRYSRSQFLYDDTIWGYVPDHHDTSKRILSPAQWDWLENQVLVRPASVRLVFSTFQVMAQGEWGFESWSLIPHELHRLQQLLVDYCTNARQPSLPILLSGDRHMGAFYYDSNYDLHEVTASSWTHTIPMHYDPDGIPCEGSDCIEPDPMRVVDDSDSEDGGIVWVNHFGTVHFHWQQKFVEVAIVQAETSPGHAAKTKWRQNTDAGQVLKKIALDIP